jgi:hypothetical protein
MEPAIAGDTGDPDGGTTFTPRLLDIGTLPCACVQLNVSLNYGSRSENCIVGQFPHWQKVNASKPRQLQPHSVGSLSRGLLLSNHYMVTGCPQMIDSKVWQAFGNVRLSP